VQTRCHLRAAALRVVRLHECRQEELALALAMVLRC